MSSLDLVSIQKSFGPVQILHDVSIALKDGEFLVLVGPSGCGKSTLMNIIAGLEEPTGGLLKLDGKDITQVAPAARDISMVFQSYALYPNMTVAKNIEFPLEMRKVEKSKRSERVQSVAKLLQIEHLLERKPRQLSGGQRQRVAIGRALAREPKLYLFDEPLSNLDAKLRAQTRLEIQKLHRELGITSLFVTHDQVEAMTLAQRMIVMNGGHMEQFGTPEEVYNRPASTFVASFIGSPPMNLLRHAPGTPEGQLLGIRPEHLQLTSGQGWSLQVETVELLGAERLVHARLGQEAVTLRLDESVSAPMPGQTFEASPRPEKVHHFDLNTGLRLSA